MWLRTLHRIARTSLDLIAPDCCAVCSTALLVGESAVCGRCRQQLAPPPIATELGGLSEIVAASTLDGLVRHAIHDLKYHRQVWRARGLGALTAEAVQTEIFAPVDLVVPVPASAARLRERGFNQAALLAAEVAHAQRVTLGVGALVRVVEREHQVGRTRAERSEVSDDYAVRGGARVEGRCVLLVDDVVTTGATLRACARALLDGGAATVCAATLAATPPRGAS